MNRVTKAADNVYDYPMDSHEVSHGDGRSPWGVRLGGPYPDGVSYLISFNWGNSTIGAFSIEDTVDTSSWKAHVIVTPDNPDGPNAKAFTGKVITYLRVHTMPEYRNRSYLSPFIGHVVLSNLKPRTKYFYKLYLTNYSSVKITKSSPDVAKSIMSSMTEGSFTTLSNKYVRMDVDIPGDSGVYVYIYARIYI